MKTKHLLTALALPAVFAACTAEDIVSEGVSVNGAQRVALNENFKMDFGGVESRLSAGEPGEAFEFTFEKGDMVGGAVIDQFSPKAWETEEDYKNQYTIVPFVSANQPFTYDGAAWTLEHTMVEGKYLFYYPYNTENNSRGAAKYSIPVMQDLSDKTTGEFNPKAAIERYGMSVGYQFLSKDDLSASVELAPIFSYARIVMTLDNQYAGGEVEKIVLQAETDAFKLNGQLDNSLIANIFESSVTNKDFDWDDYTTTAQFEIPADLAETDARKPFYNEEYNKTSNIIVGKVPAGTKMTKDAQNNHTFETYLVVPAETLTGSFKVFLYTTDGTIYSGIPSFKSTSENSLVFNRNTPKKLTVELKANTGAVPYVIASQEDWNNSVSMMVKNEVAKFIIADAEFAINNETKFPKNGTIIVDKVAVNGNNVTMTNVIAEEITVKKGAKLNADASLVANKVINEGEVVFAEIPEVESKALTIADADLNKFVASNYWVAEIENKGTLTIEEGAELTSYAWTINNEGELVVTDGTTSSTTTTEPVEQGIKFNNKEGAVVNNAGTVTLWGYNAGLINNAGAINVFEGTVAAVDEDDEDGLEEVGLINMSRTYEVVNEEDVVVNEPKIDNAATGEIRATVGTLINKSLIINAGILSCGNNEGLIKNNADVKSYPAVIDAKASSITLISNSTGGKVIVYSMKQENMSINDGTGIVEYTANANIVIDESKVTDVVAVASITITQGSDATKNGKLANLKVNADATITLVAPTTNAKTFTSIEVAEGKKMTLGSDLTTGKLVVNEKASVIVPATLTLTVTGEEANFTNEGTVVVTGALVATNVLKDKAGVVLDNGGTGSLDWQDTEAEVAVKTARTEYLDALEAAMKEWISATGDSYGFKNNCDYNLNDSLYVEIEGVKYQGAKKVFEKWMTWSSTKRDAVKTKYAAYNELLAEDDKETSNIFGYDEAKESVIAEIKATDAYKAAVKNYKLDNIGTLNDVVDFFAVDEENVVASDQTSETVKYSAKFKALEAFRKYVMDTNLADDVKTVLCSITSYDDAKAYVPDYKFAFVTDNIYKLYLDVITVYSDAEFGDSTLKTDPVLLNTVGGIGRGIVDWVKAAANLNEEGATAADKIAKEYVTKTIGETTYAIYKESLKWGYSDATVLEIKNHAANANNN